VNGPLAEYPQHITPRVNDERSWILDDDNSVLGLLHHEDVSNVTAVLKVHAPLVFRAVSV
jgi:hypothetical protein